MNQTFSITAQLRKSIFSRKYQIRANWFFGDKRQKVLMDFNIIAGQHI